MIALKGLVIPTVVERPERRRHNGVTAQVPGTWRPLDGGCQSASAQGGGAAIRRSLLVPVPRPTDATAVIALPLDLSPAAAGQLDRDHKASRSGR